MIYWSFFKVQSTSHNIHSILITTSTTMHIISLHAFVIDISCSQLTLTEIRHFYSSSAGSLVIFFTNEQATVYLFFFLRNFSPEVFIF